MITSREARRIESQLLKNEKIIDELVAQMGEIGFRLRHELPAREERALRDKLARVRADKDQMEDESAQLVEMLCED